MPYNPAQKRNRYYGQQGGGNRYYGRQEGGLDLGKYPKSYGYDPSQGKWGEGWDFLNDQQRGDLKQKIDAGYQWPSQEEQGYFAGLDTPDILGPEFLDLDPKMVRQWFMNQFRGNKKWREKETTRQLANYDVDFAKVANAGMAGIYGKGGAGSSAATSMIERGGRQYAKDRRDIRSMVQEEARRRRLERQDKGFDVMGKYAKLAGEGADRQFKELLTQLNLSTEERRYLTDLINQYIANKPDAFDTDDALSGVLAIIEGYSGATGGESLL